MSSAIPEKITISVSFRGTTYEVSFPSDAPLTRLESQLEDLTSVPPSLQKLLFRGKKVQHADNLTLSQIGLRDGLKVQMLGSTAQEIDSLNVTESEHQRREAIFRERALKPQVKVRLFIYIKRILNLISIVGPLDRFFYRHLDNICLP